MSHRSEVVNIVLRFVLFRSFKFDQIDEVKDEVKFATLFSHVVNCTVYTGLTASPNCYKGNTALSNINLPELLNSNLVIFLLYRLLVKVT